MRILDFSDGFESESSPTQGASQANSFPTYVSDAQYETFKGGPGGSGDMYFNQTKGVFRFYGNAGWTDWILPFYTDDAAYEAAQTGSPWQGAQYFNTTTNKQRTYDGTQWHNTSAVSGISSAKAADYIVLDDDNIFNILMTTAGLDRTITLPTAADNVDRVLFIKKVDTGTGDCIIDGEGAETIDGASDYTLSLTNESVTIQCDGTGWFVLSRYVPTVAVRYNSDAGQSVADNDTTVVIDFEDKVYDTANQGSDLVTIGGSWVFTAPKDGYYQISSMLSFSSGTKAVGAEYSLRLYKNGVAQYRLVEARSETTTATFDSASGTGTVFMSKGDTLHIRGFQNNGAARTLTTDGMLVWVEINRLND